MTDTASLKISVNTSEIKTANSELDKLSKTSGNTEKSTNKLERSFASLSTVLGTIGVAALTHEFVKIADEMKLLDARLKMVSASTEEYVSQKKELLGISKETYSSISEITTLYTKLDPALKSLGATTKDVNNITESFAKGLKLGGANTVEAASATLQFAQAMGSGVLRGEEFNAIMEASPKLAKYLAEGLGVPQTALRKMAQEGELSAGRVSAALLKMTAKINEDFTQIPMTVGMATTNLKTDLMTSIEQFDKTTGATKALAETIAGLSVDLTKYGTDITTFFISTSKFINEHNAALKTTASLVGGVAVAYYGFIAGGAVVSGIRGITAAVYALRTSMIALQASSPILLAISVALGVATAAYLAHDDALEKKNYSTINSIEALTKSHEDLLKKRKEITSDKFALDKTQKKETAIVDGELKKIENRLNAIGTARSNNAEKAKKEAEELIKSAKTLEENAKKLAPPPKNPKEKKAKKSDEQKEAEKQREEEAKQQAKTEHDLAQSQLSNISKITLARQEAETDVENSSIQADTDNQIRKQAIIDGWKTELEKLNTSVVDEYDFVSKMFPEGIPQEWFDNVNNRFKDLKETVSSMDFSASIEFDPAGLEGTAKSIAGIGKSMSALSKAEAQYQKNKAITGATAEETARNEREHIKDQLVGYSDMAGAMSSMFEQGSKESEALIAIQSGLAVVNAVAAVMNAGTSGDGYTAVARMLAVAATASTFLSQIGKSLSGGGTGNAPAPIANSGTVLGDSSAVSESTINIVSLLEDIHVSEYAELRDINRAVTSMAQGIESAVTNIFKTGILDTSGVSLYSKSGALGSYSNSFNSMIDKTTSQLGEFGQTIALPAKLLNPLANLASSLGLGSSKQYVAGSGFDISSGTLGSKASGNVGASTFVDVETASKNWIGQASYSHDITNTTLDKASSQSISLIYKSFSDTMMSINDGLATNLAPAITNYTMDAIKLNLQGKTGDQAIEELNNAFSALGDKMTSDVFGDILNQYQDLGEGLLETAVRVITEKAVVIQDLGDIGKTVSGDVIGISQSLVDLSGSLGDFQDGIASYYDKYFTDAEKQANTQRHIGEVFANFNDELTSLGEPMMDLDIPSTIEEFRGLVDSLSLSKEAGQKAYTMLMSVSDAFYELSKSMDSLTIADTLLVIQQLGDIGFDTLDLSYKVKGWKGKYQLIDNSSAITQSLVDLAGGLDSFSESNSTYYNNFFTDAEKQANSLKNLTDTFKSMGMVMPSTIESFRSTIEALNLNTTAGQETFTTLMGISESFYALTKATDDANKATDNLKLSLFGNIQKFVDDLNSTLVTKNASDTFYTFSSSFNEMIDAIGSGSDNLLDVGNTALSNAQNYLNVVTATATSGRDIQFAKAMLVNKFSGVIATPDLTLNNINNTLVSNNQALIAELKYSRIEMEAIKTAMIASNTYQKNIELNTKTSRFVGA